jgi:hypothetical protein
LKLRQFIELKLK